MVEYDVIVIGGGVAGSVAARFAAKNGLKTLLIEKDKTPRNKPCSGIQFGYFEKILGLKIPRERLCTNSLSKVYIEFPNGKSLSVPYKMFNFMRDTFDEWLNQTAVDAGAEFRDEISFKEFEEIDTGFIVTIQAKGKDPEKHKTRYLIAADGLNSRIHLKKHPEHFTNKSAAATINYYLKFNDGTDGKLNPKKLYMIWNIEFNNFMFAWIYKKSDEWVVGTGYSEKITERAQKFLDYVVKKFDFPPYAILKKEGFSSSMPVGSENRIFLGEGNLLCVGDAAGLVDVVRGVGMDSAALSGRKAIGAILDYEKKKGTLLGNYEKRMTKIIAKINKNATRQITGLTTNDELWQYLKDNLLKTSPAMLFGSLINIFLPAESVFLMPP